MRKRIFGVLLIFALLFTASGCRQTPDMASERYIDTAGDSWHFGFAKRQILPKEDSEYPLYIAGYNQGVEVSDVLDYCQARALWLDTGSQGVLLIGIDCVGLDSGTVAAIRSSLADVADCAAITVYSTHTHAGADTLGLWGPVGCNGKNPDYMAALLQAAQEAGREAAANRKAGTMHFAQVKTRDMYRDSRYPQCTDENLYQLRLAAADGSAGVRLYFYGAHAEALRGANTLLSRDFPGLLCDGVTAATGDEAMYCPGAIGGLVMTRDFVEDTTKDAVKNLEITADKLLEYALSLTPEQERQLAPKLSGSRTVFTVPLDNPVFLLYRFLGILQNKAVEGESATGYAVETELNLWLLDGIALTQLPGELFPELVSGLFFGDANYGAKNPRQLQTIAEEKGISQLLMLGLANDEIGYIVPPSDYLLNKEKPYLERITDYKGEDHYEETNSVGPECAQRIADAFEAALNALYK